MLKTPIEPWASASANKTTPSSAEIAVGHPAGGVANSAWVNERSGLRDEEINAANDAAQAASPWYPTDSNDGVRLCGEMQHQDVSGVYNPDGSRCKITFAGVVENVCPGWNHTTDRGCAYFVTSSVDEVYRVNSWDVGALTVDTLDLDMTNITSISQIACDKNYLYMSYANTATGNFHIAKLSLITWTGLAIEDRDTGWAWAPTYAKISICMARPGIVGAFYSIGSIFGVWATDDSSWQTGTGNTGAVSGTVSNVIRPSKIQSDYNHLYMVVKTDSGPSGGDYYMCNCAISDPTTATAPADPIVIDADGTARYLAVRVFTNFFLVLTIDGYLKGYFNDGTSDWSAPVVFGALSTVGMSLDYSIHTPSIVMAGVGRIWLTHRVDSSDTRNGSVSLVSAAYDLGRLQWSSPSASPLACTAIVPLRSDQSVDNQQQQVVFDGRNLVVFESLATTTPIRIIVNPEKR